MFSYFKFGSPLKKDNGSRNNHRHVNHCTPLLWDKYGLVGTQKKPFFSKQEYLNAHSKEIAKIIYQNWTKEGGLFATFIYENGVVYSNEPLEPQVTNSGLARQHLMSGYKHHAWNFYKTGKAESVEKCREIKEIVESYKQVVLDEIDKDIQTSTGNHKLEKKGEEVFTTEYGSKLYPRKLDFNSLYLYPRILAEIFQEANNRNNNKEKQEVRITEFADIKDLRIGKPSSISTTIGLGDREMMEELKRRVEKLLDDSKIRTLVKDYYVKKSELDKNPNVRQYEDERKEIWRNVDNEAKRIKGDCDKCSEEYLKSYF